MFNKFRDEMVRLNANPTEENKKRAKKLRIKMKTVGITLAILGWGGAIACFVLFTINAASLSGFGPKMLIPFLLFMPLAVLGSIGLMMNGVASRLVVNENIVNIMSQAHFNGETIENNEVQISKCPNCGDPISDDEVFCSKCGKQVKQECFDCGHINKLEDLFCAKCGKKL